MSASVGAAPSAPGQGAIDGAPGGAFDREMATLLVSALQLEVAADDIDLDAPLFGEGLGLDSIDALELSMAVARDYGVELKSEDARNQQVFGSLRALSRYVLDRRTK